MADRYETRHLAEVRFEPGSRRRVLKNLLGIKTKREMDRAEALALARATDAAIRSYDSGHRFTADDIRSLHKIWLGEIYEWAGNYRQVNVSKGGFPFAAASRIPVLMQVFETGPLSRHTPCNYRNTEQISAALAETHAELMLIHPFREGSGRIGRVLATLMALQAGLPLLDFSAIRGGMKRRYFAAVRAGLDRNYRPMQEILAEVIAKSRPPS